MVSGAKASEVRRVQGGTSRSCTNVSRARFSASSGSGCPSSQLFAEVMLQYADACPDAGPRNHRRLERIMRSGVTPQQRRGCQRSPADLRVGFLLRERKSLKQPVQLADIVEPACGGTRQAANEHHARSQVSTPSACPKASTSLAIPARAMQQNTSSEAELSFPPATSRWNALSANCVPACTFSAP